MPPDNETLTPRPDPTILTTEALRRDVHALREIIEEKLHGRTEVVDRRFDDMDKAIEVLRGVRANVMEATGREVSKATENVLTLIEARLLDFDHQLAGRYSQIDNQIRDQDRRFEQSKLDSKAAIDAALQAAKEAVGKTELVTDRQINSLQELIKTITKNYDDKIDDLKDRFADERNRNSTTAGNLAGTTTVAHDTRNQSNWAITTGVGALALLIGIAGVVIAIGAK